ncbi:MAG: hypothetical protein IKB99_11520 [Lentisphaeria bacterium]|nr:hypothetical protein [Lentisphaeria bacterium]
MKKKFLFLLGTLLLLTVGVLCFYFFRDNPHRQIRRTLNELCEIVSKGSGENPAVSGLKANRADKVFAPKCEIKIGRHLFDGIYTPTVLGANIMRFKSTFKWIKISYSDLEFAINHKEDGTPSAAKIFFTGQCTGVLKNAPQEKINEIRDVEAVVINTEKGWRITHLVINKILQK